MLGHDLPDLVARLATSYALIGLLVAVTVAAAFDILGVVRVPRQARPAFLSFFAILVAGFGVAFAVGLVKTPSQAAAEAAALAESDAASSARARNVTRADDALVTGSIPSGTVYIQAPDMDARFAADGLAKALRGAGFRAPGIELVASGSPSRPEVRYFNAADRPVAEKVAAIAAKNGLAGASVRAMSTYKAPAGQVEFWYPQ